jgi:sugar phosphate permease
MAALLHLPAHSARPHLWLVLLATRDDPQSVGLAPIGELAASNERDGKVLSGWWTVLANSHIRTIAAMYFFLKMTRYALLFWLPLYLVQTTHLSNNRAASTAALFEFFGFAGALLAVHLSIRYFNSRRYPVAAIMLFALGFFSPSSSPSYPPWAGGFPPSASPPWACWSTPSTRSWFPWPY